MNDTFTETMSASLQLRRRFRSIHLSGRRRLCVMAGALLCGCTPVIADPPGPPGAKQLLDQVVAARRTSGFSARGRMLISRQGAEPRTVQFIVKGRQTTAGSDFLYFALYPVAEKGRAFVVHRDSKGAVSGFIREPDGKTAPLSAARQKQPLFGSDLTIDELTDDFWTWPAPKITGQATVCRRECRIIETASPKGSDSPAALVRLWVSPETSLPLRIETYAAGGKLLKRTECRNVVKSGGHYSMEKLTIESPLTGQQTLLDFSKGSRDIEVPAGDFTAEGIAKLLKE